MVIHGNDLDNKIVANANYVTIKGAGGDDTLISGGGDDSIEGNAGDDSIDAGLGADTPQAEVERRLASGQHCVTVRRDEAIVAVRWMSTGFAEFPYLGLSFELAEGFAYVYDVYTEPSLRGRRLAPPAGLSTSGFVAEEKLTSLLGTAWHPNRSGIDFVRGAGLDMIGTLGCVRPARSGLR